MKLIERELGLEIELKENVISVIIIEKITLRLSLIQEIYSQASGKAGNWLLVENEKSFDLSKKAEMILEPFTLELNSKKLKTKLYQDIKSISQDVCFNQGVELHSNICNYMEKLLENIPYPVKYNEEWNVLEILKAYGVELVDEYDSIYDKNYNYIKMINQVCGVNIFIVVNIKEYLTEEQVRELYKLAMYSKIQLVLIEFNMSNVKYDCEDTYIIDKDGCIIAY